MKKPSEPNNDRRKLLKWMGGSVVLLSVSGLTACSDGGSEPSSLASKPEPKADPKPQPKPAATATPEPQPTAAAAEQPTETVAQQAAEPTPQPAAAGGSEIPMLSEDNPQAQALGYKHDTNDVDNARFPNHSAEQACGNCTLFAGQAGQEWGPCGIFPGNQVNSGGWCSAYSRKT